MEIVIYGLDDGNSAETKVYNKDAELAADIKAERSGSKIYLTVSGTDKPFTARSAQGLEIVIK